MVRPFWSPETGLCPPNNVLFVLGTWHCLIASWTFAAWCFPLDYTLKSWTLSTCEVPGGRTKKSRVWIDPTHWEYSESTILMGGQFEPSKEAFYREPACSLHVACIQLNLWQPSCCAPPKSVSNKLWKIMHCDPTIFNRPPNQLFMTNCAKSWFEQQARTRFLPAKATGSGLKVENSRTFDFDDSKGHSLEGASSKLSFRECFSVFQRSLCSKTIFHGWILIATFCDAIIHFRLWSDGRATFNLSSYWGSTLIGVHYRWLLEVVTW